MSTTNQAWARWREAIGKTFPFLPMKSDDLHAAVDAYTLALRNAVRATVLEVLAEREAEDGGTR